MLYVSQVDALGELQGQDLPSVSGSASTASPSSALGCSFLIWTSLQMHITYKDGLITESDWPAKQKAERGALFVHLELVMSKTAPDFSQKYMALRRNKFQKRKFWQFIRKHSFFFFFSPLNIILGLWRELDKVEGFQPLKTLKPKLDVSDLTGLGSCCCTEESIGVYVMSGSSQPKLSCDSLTYAAPPQKSLGPALWALDSPMCPSLFCSRGPKLDIILQGWPHFFHVEGSHDL